MAQTIERTELTQLQAHRGFPAITIVAPVYGTSAPDRQQTIPRVKNLVRQAQDRLEAELTAREAAPYVEKMESLLGELDPTRGGQGVALFISEDVQRLLYLPTAVEERVSINHTFATREAVVAHIRSRRYRVLSLTEKSAHIYEGRRDALQEIHRSGFPMGIQVDGVKIEIPGSYGVEPSRKHDGEEREFFNRVEHALEELHDQDALPLVLVGVERTLAYFDEVLNGPRLNKLQIVARLHGNYEKVPTSQLEEKVWPLVDEWERAGRMQALDRLTEAVGPGRAASGIGEVWPMAHSGRIDTLLVEDGYLQPARIHRGQEPETQVPGGQLEVVSLDNASESELMDDAVDQIIEAVMGAGGTVVFVENGELEKHERIAAVLRY